MKNFLKNIYYKLFDPLEQFVTSLSSKYTFNKVVVLKWLVAIIVIFISFSYIQSINEKEPSTTIIFMYWCLISLTTLILNILTSDIGPIFVWWHFFWGALDLLIRFLTWEFGPILIWGHIFTYITTIFTFITRILHESVGYFTAFYSTFIQVISDNNWVFDWFSNQFMIFWGFNATFYYLIVAFAIILLIPESFFIIGGKKLWFYITVLTLFTTLINLQYISPLQMIQSDSLIALYEASRLDDTITIELKENSLLFKLHCLRKIGLTFCVLVAYIFVLCSYIKQLVCTRIEALLYISLEYFLLKAFGTVNLLEFYIYFEAVLIPMYLLIIGWGSGEAKKGLAAYYLVFYTVFFSVPFLTAILYLGHKAGTYDITAIRDLKLSFDEEFYIMIALFLGFAVKVPVFPFHIWLPEAHVNAPTVASVILASLLLKLGSYGMVVFLITICTKTVHHYQSIFFGLLLISVIYSSMVAIVQTDLKRIVAYASIAHMNLSLLGVFAWNSDGVAGAIYQMISHGIISAALFFLVGFIYDRHHTRDITYYGGLVNVMPLFSTFFFFFTLGNMGFPGTSGFVGELLIFLGVFKYSSVVGVLSLSGAFLSAVYSIWLYNRVCFGSLNTSHLGKVFFDLNRQEVFVMLYLLIPLIVLGVYPKLLLDHLWFVKYYF